MAVLDSISTSRILAGKPSWNALSAGATRFSRPNATSVRNSTAISGPAICRAARNISPMPEISSRLKVSMSRS